MLTISLRGLTVTHITRGSGDLSHGSRSRNPTTPVSIRVELFDGPERNSAMTSNTSIDVAKRAIRTSAPISRYRWAVLGLCWLALVLTSVDRATWGPASVFVGEDLGVPLASLGAFATAYYIGYVLSNAGNGFLTDRLGGRAIVTASLIGAGIFMMIFGSTTSVSVGIAVQAAVGLFAGADYAAGVKLITSWFHPEELGKAMGIFLSASSLGVVVANSTVPMLIEHFDWTTSYHLFGALSVVVGGMCWMLLRSGPVAARTAADDSESTGAVIMTILRNRDLMLVAVAGFGGCWGTYGFLTWSNTLMIKGHSVSPSTAGFIVALFAALGVFGKPLIGIISDHFNGARRVPAIIILGCFTITLLGFGALSSPLGFLIAAPFLGLSAYCYLPLLVALIPRLVSSHVVGSSAGITNAFWQIGSVLVPITVGAVFAASGKSFLAAFATLAAGPLIAVVALCFVNERPSSVSIVVKGSA
ncbi:MFS transporter [Rhodococcus opacus]|uniref:MFS transporter n=1 Tax=Rhodococcus opacus TaxID=37919 RepID=UPI002952CBF9|nr:MFS transporter [Rhodococcus opacus]MDV7089332.1 MFS transporter [Rhodococcus opacus]